MTAQANPLPDTDEDEVTIPVQGDRPLAVTADPESVSHFILTERSHTDGHATIRFWGDSWWLWENGKYNGISNHAVRALVTKGFRTDYRSVESKHVTNVLEHLRADTILSPAVLLPSWINPHGTPDWKLSDCVITRNAIVNLPAFVGCSETFSVPATPNLFNTVATDFDFLSDAPEPVQWLEFLGKLWPDDQESIDCLQKMFGYLLTSDTSQQKMFVLIGPRRGGKGTIANILANLIGLENVAGPTLAGLSSNFGLQQLIGKSLAVVSDLRLGPSSNRSVIVERLLAITGEDMLTVDRKNTTAVHCHLPTRFLILSNELPRLDDSSATIISRMIVLKMTESFYGQEDTDLLSKLLPELPGIFLWAIQGWEELKHDGRFAQPESAKDLIGELEALASPVTAFIDDRCEIDPNASVAKQDIYKEWARWCELNGFRPGTINRFGQSLRSAFPKLSDGRLAEDGDGKRPTCYYGIGLRP